MARESRPLIIDYGMGNLRSVEKSLAGLGARPELSGDPDAVRQAERLILPGVGAFGAAIRNLNKHGLHRAILDAVQ